MDKGLKSNRVEGEIKVHEKKMMEKARLEKLAKLEKTFDTLKGILTAINNKDIEQGINKDYCFVTDEDGELVFLKRPKEAVIGEPDPEMDGETRTQWPYNSSDGIVLWNHETGYRKGLEITESFLNALDIKYLGIMEKTKIDKIQEVYEEMNLSLVGKYPDQITRDEIKEQLLKELNFLDDIKCDQENNPCDVVDKECIVARLSWNTMPNGEHTCTYLVFGHPENARHILNTLNYF